MQLNLASAKTYMVFLQIEEMVYLGKDPTLNSKKTVGGIIEKQKRKKHRTQGRISSVGIKVTSFVTCVNHGFPLSMTKNHLPKPITLKRSIITHLRFSLPSFLPSSFPSPNSPTSSFILSAPPLDLFFFWNRDFYNQEAKNSFAHRKLLPAIQIFLNYNGQYISKSIGYITGKVLRDLWRMSFL